MTDTIFALSSGSPPAAIGVIRISGPLAGVALERLAGSLPAARRPKLASLRAEGGDVIDRALVLWFPHPGSVTGEDLAEIHCHGGRAVVAAIEAALGAMDGLRRAQPGEFTRRSFANGRIDLAEAEGLADLLSAETELQRQAAMAVAGGGLSRRANTWRDRVLGLSALVEASLDFGDEDDVGVGLPPMFHVELDDLRTELLAYLEAPTAERLRDGIRVVFAGPPNAGKSSLFNAILDEGAAIVSAEAGTTRDVIERPVSFNGIPFVLVDTAGLRDDGAGEIERIGIGKAEAEIAKADVVLWLGAEGEGPAEAVEVATKCDHNPQAKPSAKHRVSATTGEGISKLVAGLADRARVLLPKPGALALSSRQRVAVADAAEALGKVDANGDLLIVAERLRSARLAFDRLLGRHSTEDMLDALFGRFCIGK